jgi:hypothetical protein
MRDCGTGEHDTALDFMVGAVVVTALALTFLPLVANAVSRATTPGDGLVYNPQTGSYWAYTSRLFYDPQTESCWVFIPMEIEEEVR